MKVYYFTKKVHGLDNIRQRRLKIARIADLNDPFEFTAINLPDKQARLGLQSFKAEMSKDVGLICLSTSWHHPLMWSHYADKHQGMCLEFEIPDTSKLWKIEYRRHLPTPEDLGHSSIDDFEMADLISTWFVKSSVWGYEKERRLLLDLETNIKDGPHYFMPFNVNMRLVGVIVGARSQISRAELAEALGPHASGVKARLARLAFKSFSVVTQSKANLWR